MRALVTASDSLAGLSLGEVPDPDPRPEQVLIQVEAISLNRGEIMMLSGRQSGTVSGWDAAGTVIQQATSGAGPSEGEKVVTFGWGGAWAEKRAVDLGELANLPDGVDVGEASALPVAGVTALRAIRACGEVSGRRLMVTGASGGVGRFAVQLARIAGAHVVAVVGSSQRAEGLKELGAEEIAVGIDTVEEPVAHALETVGGDVLTAAISLVEPNGRVISIGAASGDFRPVAEGSEGRRVVPFQMGSGLAEDLSYLVELLGSGELDPQIGWRGGWDRVPEAAQALMNREVNGKAVLEVR